ncbi:hypothetical protein D3C71_1647270 [compost metagenome]
MAHAHVAGHLTIAPGPGRQHIALNDFPRTLPGQQPLAIVLDEHRAATVTVAQRTLERQRFGWCIEDIAEPAVVGTGDPVEPAAKLGAVGAVGRMPRSAGTRGALSQNLRDLTGFVAVAVKGHRRHIGDRRLQPDQRNIIARGEKHHDEHRLAAGHRLIDQRLR